jgi:hypothetical protein
LTLDIEGLVQHYRDQLRTVIEGRRWIVATDVLIGGARLGKVLQQLGAEQVLCLATSRGVGDLPESEDLQCIEMGLSGHTDMMEAIRASGRALTQLPDWVQAEIDRFDPSHEARVLENIFSSGVPVGGRTVFGPRLRPWQALEDKMIIDALWDDAGIARAPSAVLPAELDALQSAHERLDLGMGTAWVGDNREGWHGGAKLLRWVRSAGDGIAAHEFLAARCDRVRVMPFLDGIPCSIHGWVFPGQVIGFRPCEMLVFRVPGSAKLSYAGAATCWEPSAAVTHAMEDAVMRVGEHLRQSVGYLGSFTLDGVVTADGFRPTELNPRFGAAISRMARGMPDLPLYLLHVATTEGAALDFRPSSLQALVRTQAAAHPVVRGMHMLEGQHGIEERSCGLCRHGEGWREAESSEQADATLRVGPATAGALVFVSVEPHAIHRGRSAAPDVSSLIAFADQLWDLGIGPLQPAPDLNPVKNLSSADLRL